MTAQLDRDIFGNLLSYQETTGRRYHHPDGLGSTLALLVQFLWNEAFGQRDLPGVPGAARDNPRPTPSVP